MNVRPLEASFLRSSLIARRLIVTAACANSVSVALIVSLLRPHDATKVAIIAGLASAVGPAITVLIVRFITSRDGWASDRPAAVALPISAGEYMAGVLAVSVFGGMVSLAGGLAGLFMILLAIPNTAIPIRDIMTVAAVVFGVIVVLGFIQVPVAIIARRRQTFTVVLAVSGVALASMRFIHSVVVPLSADWRESVGAILAAAAILAVIVIWRQAIRAFDDAYAWSASA